MTDPRLARGVHYTPDRVARYLARVALDPWLEAHRKQTTQLTVLDPACGDGMLLGAVLERFSQLDCRGASLHLVGVDIRAEAIEAAQRHLGTQHAERVVWELVEGDALGDLGQLDRHFDVVVGNPPYVFGEHLVTLDRALLAERYELGRRGQPDLFKLFYERTLAVLRSGGRHAFLVPDAILARDEHGDLRRLLAERLHVDSICQVGRIFASAPGVASVVVAGSSRASAPTVSVDRWRDDEPARSHEVRRDWLISSGGGPWSVDAPPEWFGPEGLRALLERPGVRLAQLLAPGQRGLTRGEELGKSRLTRLTQATLATWHGRVHEGLTPIYAGESVNRHHLDPPGRVTQAAAVVKKSEYYAGPKILFVKTGAGPVASTCDDDLPVLQSVYTLHLADRIREQIDEDAVVAVLCSAVLGAYAWHRWTFGKRLQPQLTLDNLRCLPMPSLETLAAASDELSRFVSRIRSGLTSGADVTGLERDLDRRVASLYGLEFRLWEPMLEATLRKLPASQRSRWVGVGEGAER